MYMRLGEGEAGGSGAHDAREKCRIPFKMYARNTGISIALSLSPAVKKVKAPKA